MYFKCLLIPGRFGNLVSRVDRVFFFFFSAGEEGSQNRQSLPASDDTRPFLDWSYSPTSVEICPRKFEKNNTVLQQFQ